jgi:hypothetical protein
MELATLQEHLEIAEKQVADVGRQLDEQNAVIQNLKRNHFPTGDAEQQLFILTELQSSAISTRDRLLEEIELFRGAS